MLAAGLWMLARPDRGSAAPITLLGSAPAPGQTVSTWGPNSSATVSTDGMMEVEFDGGLRPAGAFLSIGRGIDLFQDHDRLYLSFDMRGGKGGESISLTLRDGSVAGGTDGYQVQANQPDGFVVTTTWQTLVMPLTDFPTTGENWTLPVPPGAQRPLRRKIDWSNINGFGISTWSGPAKVYLRNLVISTNPDTGPVRLLGPIAVPSRVDLSHGAPLSLAASFDRPTRWQIRITQPSASMTFADLAGFASVKWDGASDEGEFREGPCEVRLTYGNARRETTSTNFVLGGPHSPRVQVAQAGYAPGRGKTACVMGERTQRTFRVVNAMTGKVALAGISGESARCEQAGDWGSVIDFSSVRAPGEYYVQVEGVGRSYFFPIRDGIYEDLLQKAMKSYYYQRCGINLVAPYAGPYVRKACHGDDAWLYEGSQNDVIVRGAHIASTGGWHDAGDYGKKIVAASDALGYLLMTCEVFPARAKALHLNLPGDAAMPDILREIKYELDWMLTMQDPDGGVHTLITSPDFFLTDTADKDPQPRYIVGVSSCATGDFAAIMAQAARVYRPYDGDFASHCRAAAKRAWVFLEKHPEIIPAGGYHDPPGIHGTGTYDDSDDRDERFRAACELFVTSGEARYDRYVREHYGELKPELFEPPGYMHTQGFGLYSYVLCGKGDKDLVDRFKGAILAYARKARSAIEVSPYGIAIDLTPYWWNNWTALQSAAALIVAGLVEPREAFPDSALRQLNYVLGCNPVDRCYVTGFGSRPVMDPWQPACAFGGLADPIPGFVLPGANLVAWDLPMQRHQEIHRLPPLKNYVDDHRAASVNEVCLNFNGPFVFVTAFLSR
jgi:endoglucanase